MNLIQSFLLILCLALSSKAFAKTWDSMSLDDRAEILSDLEYISDEDLPENSEVIRYVDAELVLAGDLIIPNPDHRIYIEKIIEVFEDEVSREDIEQSEYSAFGDPQISLLYLLIDHSGAIVGALLGFYQDGRDIDGEDSDVNWSAYVRFNSEGEILSDENSQTYDELYFEWSGH